MLPGSLRLLSLMNMYMSSSSTEKATAAETTNMTLQDCNSEIAKLDVETLLMRVMAAQVTVAKHRKPNVLHMTNSASIARAGILEQQYDLCKLSQVSAYSFLRLLYCIRFLDRGKIYGGRHCKGGEVGRKCNRKRTKLRKTML
ncbi:hypothetical protein Bca4012_010726 [Brassica carinata]